MTIEEAREVLGVSSDATEEETRKAYRRKASIAHPDRPSGDAWYFRRLGEARDLLLAPEEVEEGVPPAQEPTSQDASERLHPLVREALEALADEGSTETLERILGCRAGPAQAAVRTFLSVLRGPQRSTRRKRKTK